MGMVSETLGSAATGAWGAGVVSAVDATELPPDAAASGLNSALANASMGVAFVQKRRGVACLNTTPITGVPAIIGQYQLRRTNGDVFNLLISNAGRLDQWITDHTSTIDATAFTSGDLYPDFETANDWAFIVNGTDAVKTDGANVRLFGIVRPTVGTLAGAAGAAGSPNGTYELRVSYFNSTTGHESSASDSAAVNVTVSNQKIDWSNIPTSSDPQVDTVRLLVRNTATMTQFYLAGSVSNGTTTATTDFLDSNLLTAAPTTTSNNPPPAGVKFIAFYEGRLFVATEHAIYWSAISDVESFDPLATDLVNVKDGQKITGIFADHEVLIILKEDRTYTLVGNDPATWQIRLLDAGIGCVNHRTIVSIHNYTWWWARQGLVRWAGGADIDTVGLRLYGDPTETVNFDSIAVASAAASSAQPRLLIALPASGQTRATFILPFNYIADAFEASSWDIMDAASLGTGIDTTGSPQMYLGGYAGQFFRLWSTNNDGVVSGTTSGTVVPSGTTMAVLTDPGATFDTTGGGLVERRVTLLDPDHRPVATRPRITANTATDLTFDVALDNLTPGVTYTYVIGAPNFQWDTPWRTFDLPWHKKRFEYFFLLSKGTNFGTSAFVDIFFDYTDQGAKTRTISSQAVGAEWDSAIWDVDVWDTPGNVRQRFRVGRTGFSWKARIRNADVNAPYALLMIGAQAVTQTTKR